MLQNAADLVPSLPSGRHGPVKLPTAETAARRRRHRIAVIAPATTPIRQPFTGGLQAHVWTLTRALRDRGHHVTLFAAPGSDASLRAEELTLDLDWLSGDARRDVSMPADAVVAEHHAYLELMMRLARGRDQFAVVHNHSFHYLPVAMSDVVAVPMLTTLHTPPTPWLESAIQASARGLSRFVAVSQHTADAWRPAAGPVPVIPNGVDCQAWPAGTGGGPLVWSGRVVPEKGLHLAIAAAQRAGRPIDIAGPVVDQRYFDERIAPTLDHDVRYLGHLDQPALSRLVRTAALAVVTPDWDEPYGLVVAEALASGTPVVGFARGGIPEIIDASCGVLVAPGDVDALARAMVDGRHLERARARLRAEQHCSLEIMIDRYERMLDDIIMSAAA